MGVLVLWIHDPLVTAGWKDTVSHVFMSWIFYYVIEYVFLSNSQYSVQIQLFFSISFDFYILFLFHYFPKSIYYLPGWAFKLLLVYYIFLLLII